MWDNRSRRHHCHAQRRHPRITRSNNNNVALIIIIIVVVRRHSLLRHPPLLFIRLFVTQGLQNLLENVILGSSFPAQTIVVVVVVFVFASTYFCVVVVSCCWEIKGATHLMNGCQNMEESKSSFVEICFP